MLNADVRRIRCRRRPSSGSGETSVMRRTSVRTSSQIADAEIGHRRANRGDAAAGKVRCALNPERSARARGTRRSRRVPAAVAPQRGGAESGSGDASVTGGVSAARHHGQRATPALFLDSLQRRVHRLARELVDRQVRDARVLAARGGHRHAVHDVLRNSVAAVRRHAHRHPLAARCRASSRGRGRSAAFAADAADDKPARLDDCRAALADRRAGRRCGSSSRR